MKLPFLLVVGLLFLLGVTGLLSACGGSKAQPSGPLAPDFTVRTTDGAEFTLARQRGKVVVIDFIIANCPSCAVEVPALARVYQQYRDRGLEVLVLDVNPYETEADLLQAKRRFGGGDHRWAIDEGQRVTRAYGVRSLGTTVIVGQRGRIAYADYGATSYEKLQGEVEKLLQ